MQTPSQQARARLATVRRTGDAAQIREAKQDLAATRIETFVSAVLTSAPPLRPTQVAALSALLGGGPDESAAIERRAS